MYENILVYNNNLHNFEENLNKVVMTYHEGKYSVVYKCNKKNLN